MRVLNALFSLPKKVGIFHCAPNIIFIAIQVFKCQKKVISIFHCALNTKFIAIQVYKPQGFLHCALKCIHLIHTLGLNFFTAQQVKQQSCLNGSHCSSSFPCIPLLHLFKTILYTLYVFYMMCVRLPWTSSMLLVTFPGWYDQQQGSHLPSKYFEPNKRALSGLFPAEQNSDPKVWHC